MKTSKVWLVTSAARGFGFDITRTALDSGDRAIATARSKPERMYQANAATVATKIAEWLPVSISTDHDQVAKLALQPEEVAQGITNWEWD